KRRPTVRLSSQASLFGSSGQSHRWFYMSTLTSLFVPFVAVPVCSSVRVVCVGLCFFLLPLFPPSLSISFCVCCVCGRMCAWFYLVVLCDDGVSLLF
ncbi:unnamed protein product, partial [Polarella glacialis]